MNILSRLIYLFTAAEHSSVVSHVFSFVGGLESNFIFQVIRNFFVWIFNWILRLIWVIEKLVLGIMEALEYIVNTFMGIGSTIDDIFGFDTNLFSTLIKTFRALFGVAIVLMIIFTIFALIKQEYANATSESGMSDENNKKGPIIKRMFISLLAMIMVPFAMIFIIGALNSVLTALNNALKGDKNTTIAGQVLATSTFDTNKYRTYAENNKRIPIVISAYDASEYKPDEKEKLYSKIKSASIQKKLKTAALNISNNAQLSFNSALTYSNNKIENSENYGDFYETFVCTAEQYQVLADFIDYCELSNAPFYIKSLADEDIEWKYVETSVFNKDESSLTISYRDANDLNSNGKTNDTYTITYSMGFDVTSPVSDALNSISALLGLTQDEDGNYLTYHEMERDQDSINVVHWANEKASIHFSENFNISDMNTWTVADQILMYEYYHWSTNNTLGDYKLDDLSYSNRGMITLDVYQILYREYYPEADAYSREIPIECVRINGSYYKVVKSLYESDGYGNSYYELLQIDGADFLDKPYSIVTMESDVDENGNVITSSGSGPYATLKLVGRGGTAFDLNDPNTWTYTDQILIYEYYSNLSYSNNLYKYDITDFYKGINVPVYKIKDYKLGETDPTTDSSENLYYALINGTYYQIDTDSKGLLGLDPGNFLEQTDSSHVFSSYSYTGNNGDIVIHDDESRYGISTNNQMEGKTVSDFIVDENSSNFSDIESRTSFMFSETDVIPDFILNFSSNFDYRDTSTWSFKDYFLFYVYVKYMAVSGYSTESLKSSPLPGSIGLYGDTNEYYFRINPALTGQKNVYLKVKEVNDISEQNMQEMIDAEETYRSNEFNTFVDLLFTNVSDVNTVFARTETESRVFNFSSRVSYEDVYNWKMSDFLLFLLDNMGYISISVNKNTDLAKYSYNSICYKVTTDTGEKQNLYAFGTDKKIYLNEKYILNLDLDGNGQSDYANLDSWLTTSLMSYLTAYITHESGQNIILNEASLLQKLMDKDIFNDKIFTYSTLLRTLIKDYGLKLESDTNLFESFNDIKKFTYVNPDEGFYNNRSDLTKWTAFDFMEYALTGSVTGSYTGYLVKTKDADGITRTRYLFKDSRNTYAISIDAGSFFEANCTLSGTVESSNIDLLDGQGLSDYYEQNLKDLVISVLSSENRFYRANNVTYTYTKEDGVNTRLDSILAGLGITEQAEYKFKTYINGSDVYLYLGSGNGYNYFIGTDKFAADATAYIAETASITPSRSGIFTNAGNYLSFSGGEDHFSVTDAVIAQLTGDTTPQTYLKYKLNDGNDHEYIYVGNQFVEVTAESTEYFELGGLNTKIADESADACINMLMRNYYSRYIVSPSELESVVNSTPIYFDLLNSDTAGGWQSFSLEDVSTWSPLNIILYSENALGREESAGRVSGTYHTTASGRSYIHFTIISQLGESKDLYVDVTDLLASSFKIEDYVDRDNCPITRNNEADNQIKLLRYHVAMSVYSQATDGDGNEVDTYLTPTEALDIYLTLVDNVSAIYNNDITENYTTQQRIQISTDTWLDGVMSKDDVSTWNWLDIVYNYYFTTSRTTDQYVCYTDADGKIYLCLNGDSDGTQVYVNFDTEIFSMDQSFSTFNVDSQSVSFSLTNKDNSLIGLLYYKYTGLNSGSVDYLGLTDSVNIYIIKNYDNNEYSYVFYDEQNGKLEFTITQSEYSYTTGALVSNLQNWNMFDLVLRAARGNTKISAETVVSKIYNFNGEKYFYTNNYYINISMIEDCLNIPTDVAPPTDNTQTGSIAPLVITVKDKMQKVSDLLFEPTHSGTDKTLIELEESVVSVGKIEAEENADKPDDGDVKLYFSDNFDFSDYTTWTNADFILYYLFSRGQMNVDIKSFQYYVNLGYVPASVYYLETTDSFGNIKIEKVYKVGGGVNDFGNFLDALNNKSIEDLRNELSDDAFKQIINRLSDFYFIRESQWIIQYGRKIRNIFTNSNPDVDLKSTYSVTNEPTTSVEIRPNNFTFVKENNQISSDFSYDNYYYFVEDSSKGNKVLQSLEVNSEIVNKIVNKNYDGETLVNLKLSEGFQIDNISTWTILDYVVIREFARGSFKKTEFSDLTADYYHPAYCFGTNDANENNDEYYIYIGGFYYNITSAVSYINGSLENKAEYKFVSDELSVTKLGDVFSYNFRVLVNDYNFVFGTSNNENTLRELIKTDTTLTFPRTYMKIIDDSTEKERTDVYFRELDNNKAGIYKVNLSLLDTYTISPMVKEVGWVEKLMNDMQVIYPDLNWANLIANDGWLDTLGDYYSAYASGEYLGTGNSANITASGMVLSEFLLSIAQISTDGYADYEYHSVFDENIIRSLMLSLMGEQNYNNLVLEAQVFVDMFNFAFAQILDDISYERNIPVVEGNVDNLAMCVYKAYLATTLLSSDLGEYLYVLATRILSQYTIYESLAYSTGDYTTYYAYINGYPDENGDAVDAFSYGSFQKLVQFENENLRSGKVPTFTYNYIDVYRSLVTDHEVSDEEIMLSLYCDTPSVLSTYLEKMLSQQQFTELLVLIGRDSLAQITEADVSNIFSKLTLFDKPKPLTFNELNNKLNTAYNETYVGSWGSTATFKSNDSTRYSYLNHVYWSIRQNLNNRGLSSPSYLKIYYNYITNKIERWEMENDLPINGASNSIPEYGLYKAKLLLYKLIFISKLTFAYTSNSIYVQKTEDQTMDEYLDSLPASESGSNSETEVNRDSLVGRLETIFGGNSAGGTGTTSSTNQFLQMWSHIFNRDFLGIDINDYVSGDSSFGDGLVGTAAYLEAMAQALSERNSYVKQTFKNLSASESGNMANWRDFLTMRDEMQKMLSEISEMAILNPGQKTENGTVYPDGYSEQICTSVYSSLYSLYETLDSYISTQQTIDRIEKASITFTLAQFSANYVEDGFDFTIQNKSYTLKTSVSTQRLAEYVYGGQFLSQYGVYAQYTSPYFEGIVQTTKAYDDNDDFVKTSLTLFPLLRTFASKIADYTAKLYFLTNLNDTSRNISDSILLMESIYSSNNYLTTYFGRAQSSPIKTTLEYLILDHIISDEELSADTLMRLMFSDTVESLGNMNCTDDYLVLLAKYLEGEPMTSEEYNRNASRGVTRGENQTIADLSDEFKKTALHTYLAYVQTTSSTVKEINSDGTETHLSNNDINGYYGLYKENGYNAFGALSSGADTAAERIHRVFVNVITYLTLSDEQKEENNDLGSVGEPVNFDDMAFKDLKAFLMKSLGSYQKNEQETGAENASRYLTLFNLVSGEFNLTIQDLEGKSKFVGRTLPAINYYKNNEDRVVYLDAEHSQKYDLSATFKIDSSTRGTVLRLCGIENRPIEELVSLKYNELYQRDGNYDEAKNDVFIVCSYDDDLGKYIPYMATNRKYTGSFAGTKYMDYIKDYGHNIYTDYYDSPTGTRFAYPIIAKGVITADLKPTAIRIVNNQVDFYRTDITASSEVDDSALNRVTASSETTTIGYVRYVSYSSFNSAENKSASKMNYLATNDITSYVSSGASVYYLQRTSNYVVGKVDDFDGISVLDDFSTFFKMSFQMHFIMVLGFITLIPLLFRASGAVLRRILDLILLVLIGPLCISMNSLNYNDQEHQTYSSWKKFLTETLLNVIGLVICFNLYYIIVSTTMNMTFVSDGDSTMTKLNMIGGLSFVTARLLNGFIRFIFIIVATNMIQTAADMLANMITGGKVKKSFGSPLANGENAVDSVISFVKKVVSDVNKVVGGVQDLVSGKIFLEAKNALIESMPGSKLVQGVANGVGNMKNKQQAKSLYKDMKDKGVNPAVAKSFQKEFRNNYKQQQQQKQQRRQQSAQSFYSKFGMKANY